MRFENMMIPGNTIKIFFNENNINNKTIHIRDVVDDDMVVYRFWSRPKKRWRYDIDSMYYFKLLFDKNVLSKTGKQNKKPAPFSGNKLSPDS
jgi:hypothetical protein